MARLRVAGPPLGPCPFGGDKAGALEKEKQVSVQTLHPTAPMASTPLPEHSDESNSDSGRVLTVIVDVLEDVLHGSVVGCHNLLGKKSSADE